MEVEVIRLEQERTRFGYILNAFSGLHLECISFELTKIDPVYGYREQPLEFDYTRGGPIATLLTSSVVLNGRTYTDESIVRIDHFSVCEGRYWGVFYGSYLLSFLDQDGRIFLFTDYAKKLSRKQRRKNYGLFGFLINKPSVTAICADCFRLLCVKFDGYPEIYVCPTPKRRLYIERNDPRNYDRIC